AHFPDWKERYFSEEELELASVSGPLADPGGRGVPNLMRYAFGMEPADSVRDLLPVVQVEAADGEPSMRLTLSYTRNRMARDLEFAILASEDLRNWEAVPEENIVERTIAG